MADNEGGQKDQVSIVFENKDDSPTLPVTGVWGGPTMDGTSLFAHLYMEYQSTPNVISLDVDDSGQVQDPNQGQRISRGEITRDVQVTLMMSPQQAISIGRWLQRRGEQMLSQGSE